MELLKGGITLASVALGAVFGFWVYFRQKEYELTKQRYLDQGLDQVASSLETALGIISHNYARALQLCRQYRDLGVHFQTKELELGFVNLDSTNFHQIAQSRVRNLIRDDVVWLVYQSAFATAASANALISQEIPVTLRIYAETKNPGNTNAADERKADVEKMFVALESAHEETFRYAALSQELQVLVHLLEETTLSRKAITNFHKRKEVTEAVTRLRNAYTGEIAQHMTIEQKVNPVKKSSSGIGYFISGLALGILPIVWIFFLVRNTIELAQNPAAMWWLSLWILLANGWLLLDCKVGESTRKAVEWSAFIAGAATFITLWVLGAK